MQTTTDQVVGDQMNVADGYPVLTNFLDVIIMRKELIKAVKENPLQDKVYFFPHLKTCCVMQQDDETFDKRGKLPIEFLEEEWNWCIAGSKALHAVQVYIKNAAQMNMKTEIKDANIKSEIEFLRTLEAEGINGNIMIKECNFEKLRQAIELLVKDSTTRKNLLAITNALEMKVTIYGVFSPSDTDIFFLNSVANHRYLLGNVDIVHTKAKTVEELILNFDLPCCRAAFNSRSDFWISAQCLASLLTGSYYLPNFIKNAENFKNILGKYKTSINSNEMYLHTRMLFRITKYENYGFSPIFISGDTIPDWIKNRFHYGEWKEQNNSSNTLNKSTSKSRFDDENDSTCTNCRMKNCTYWLDGEEFCKNCRKSTGNFYMQ